MRSDPNDAPERPLLRIGLVLVALVTGLIAYSANSGIVLVLAVGLAALAFLGIGDAPLGQVLPEATIEQGLRRRLRQLIAWQRSHPAVSWLLLATVSSGVAALLVYRNDESAIPVAFWLAALALLAGAGLRQDRLSLTELTALARRGWKAVQAARLEALLLAGATAVGFALRAYDLAHFPPMMHGDEGEMGLLALRVLEGPDPVPFFATLWLDHPTAFYYLQAAALLVFGKTEVGLRMLSALFGAACIPLVWGIARLGWGAAAALTAAWLLAVSHLLVHYSRLGLNNIQSVFSMLLLLLLLFLIARLAPASGQAADALGTAGPVWPRGRLALFIAAGLVIGISQYLYYGSRLLPVVALPLLLVQWRRGQARLAEIGALVLTAVIAFAPLAAYYAVRPHTFLSRMQGVSILRDENLRHALGPDASLPGDLLPLLIQQLRLNLGFFIRDGDGSAFYLRDIPAFDPVTVLLGWLGLGVALTRLRRFHELAILTWLGLGIVLGGIMTNDPPNGPRLIVVVPAVFVLAGIFVQRLGGLVGPSPRAYRPAAVVAATGAVALLWLNATTYFGEYAQKAPGSMAIRIAREMIAEPPDQYRTFLIGDPILFVEYGTIRFVARGSDAQNLPSTAPLPSLPEDGKGLLVIAVPQHAEQLRAVEARWPGGTTTHAFDNAGRPVYVAYRLPPRSS